MKTKKTSALQKQIYKNAPIVNNRGCINAQQY